MERRNRPTELTDAPEHRITARFELRDDGDEESGEITLIGYASTFEPYEMHGGPSLYGWIEQLDPHAFDKTLREKPDLHLLINHEGMPLARTKSGTLKLSVDSHGLKVEAKLDRADPDVQRLEAKMRRGDMDEMSFAFRVKAQKWEAAPGFEDDDQSKRTLLEVSLHKGDVSVVNFGANPTTSAEIKGFRAAVDLLAGHQWHRVPVRKTLLPSPTLIELHQTVHTPDTLVIPNQTAATNQLKQLAEAALRKTPRELSQ